MAGAAALLRQARPELSADDVREVMVNTARPFAFWAEPMFWDAVHRQGSGMIDVHNAINNLVKAVPEKINLEVFNEEVQVKTFEVEVYNDSDEAVTYDMGARTSVFTNFNVPTPRLNAFFPGQEYVTISGPTTLTVEPGETVTVPITFEVEVDVFEVSPPNPAGLNSYILGGWIQFSGQGDAGDLNVPWVAFVGDPQSRTVFGNDAYPPGLLPIAFYVDAGGSDLPGTVIEPDAGDHGNSVQYRHPGGIPPIQRIRGRR